MSENVVLEEEFDPNYVPTKKEIEEYAGFLGMDLNDKENQDLVWIAEEGLKAPLPSEWKPCKTDDDDIYYFNFETGESRWEHPCDEYYKNLYKTEKQKQLNKTTQDEISSKSPLKDQSKKIKAEFESLFQNEIETILESDALSSDNENGSETLSQLKDTNTHKTKENDIDAKLHKLEKWKTEENDECHKEKKLYLKKLENEMNKFKNDLEKQQQSDIKLFEEKIQKTMKQKEIMIQNKYKNSLDQLQSLNQEKLLKLKESEKEIVEIKHKLQTEINEIKNKFNQEKDDLLKEQNAEIETLKNNHEQRVHKVTNTMELNIQKQNDALNSLKGKKQTLEDEYNVKLKRINMENEEKLNEAKIKWKKEFEECKTKHDTEIKTYIDGMEQKKINRLSEKECEMEQNKENKKSIMNKEYQHWKQQKEEYYEQRKDTDIQILQCQHQEEIEAMKENMKQERIEFEKGMKTQQQIKKDQITNEYKIKNMTLLDELETEHNQVLNEKYDTINKLQSTNMELRNEISELRKELKEQHLQQQEEIEINDDDDDDDKSIVDDDSESFLTLQPIDIESEEANEMMTSTSIPMPSEASEWSEYLQKERHSIDLMRERINVEKKSMRQKQRKIEMMKTEWMKDRDKLKSITNKEQFKSTKNILKKKKHNLDDTVVEMNEEVLEIRDATQILNKRESRLETLEIEYLRAQNKYSNTSLKSETHSWTPRPPTYPKQKGIYDDTLQQRQSQRNIHDIQSVHNNIQRLQDTSSSSEFQQRLMMNSNSTGHHAFGSVISKYVKHNQHTQRTIDHHKCWLKAFQSELQQMSHTMNHNVNNNVSNKVSRHIKHITKHTAKHTKYKENNGEVVIRVKIEK